MIPVVPLPAFPCPHRDPVRWTPVFGPDLRASHADRDVAADILCAAVADGRLTLDELDERLEHVLSARTLREIARLISDLPGHRFSGPATAAGRGAAPRRPTGPRALAAWFRPSVPVAGPRPPAMPATPPRTPTTPAALSPGDRPRPAAESRWSLLQSLAAPTGCP
jgi:hypothetical protein